MQITMSRAVTALALGASVVLGLCGCAPADSQTQAPHASASSATSTKSAPPTAAGAQATLDAYFAQLKIDSIPYLQKSVAAGGTTASNDTKKAVFKEVFHRSLAYMDPSMTEQAAQDMSVAYATWFVLDPKATLMTDEQAFKVAGNTATVLGTSFKWNALGVALPKASDDANTHVITLKSSNGKWLISGYAPAH